MLETSREVIKIFLKIFPKLRYFEKMKKKTSKTSIYIDVFLKNIDVEKYLCFPNIAQH